MCPRRGAATYGGGGRCTYRRGRPAGGVWLQLARPMAAGALPCTPVLQREGRRCPSLHPLPQCPTTLHPPILQRAGGEAGGRAAWHLSAPRPPASSHPPHPPPASFLSPLAGSVLICLTPDLCMRAGRRRGGVPGGAPATQCMPGSGCCEPPPLAAVESRSMCILFSAGVCWAAHASVACLLLGW